jgi:IS30 family transposase
MKVISRYMRRSRARSRIWVALYSQVSVPYVLAKIRRRKPLKLPEQLRGFLEA